VESLLQLLPTMHQNTSNVESALGPAVEAATMLMTGLNPSTPLDGGRLNIFVGGLPSIGKARLQNREQAKLRGSENEHSLLKPANEFYRRTATNFSRYQIVSDVYCCTSTYCDLSTLNGLARFSGGTVFHCKEAGDKVSNELYRNLTREQGWEAVVRTRCSKGMKLSNFQGNFYLRGSDLLALPGANSSNSFTCELKNEEVPLASRAVSIQSALLYTTSSGERRIRVHNAIVPVVSDLPALYNAANPTTVLSLLSKKAIIVVTSQSFAKARDSLQSSVIQLCRQKSAALRGQQGGEDRLQCLPAMALGLIRNTAFRPSANVPIDERLAALTMVKCLGTPALNLLVQPRLLPLYELSTTASVGALDENNHAELPAEARLCSSELAGGLHLIDTGVDFFIRVGADCSVQLLNELFGVSQLQANLSLSYPQQGDTASACARLHNILNTLRFGAWRHQSATIVVAGTAQEELFLYHLVEDRSLGVMSLGELHAHIGDNRF